MRYGTGYGSLIGRLLLIIAVSLYSIVYMSDPAKWGIIDSFNLVMHEAGHTIFRFFGEFVHVLAGSAFQVFVPAVFALYFFLRGDRTEAAVLLAFVGINLINVSIYAADAVMMQLPLLGGEAVIHDWNYLLSRLDVLEYTSVIAKSIYSLGVLTIFASIVGSLVSLYYDHKNEQQLLRERDIVG